jgi:hypothetical protein
VAEFSVPTSSGFNDTESSHGGLLLKTVAAAADGSSSSQGHTVPLLQEMADMDTEIDVPLLLDQVEDNRSEQTLESPTEDELGVESLDYDPIHSFVSSQQKRAQQRRHFYGYTGLTLAKWSITIMIGILVGDCLSLSLSLSPFDKKNYLRAVFPYY